ncbi:MAG: hypothetical protein QXM53_09075, partial [Thermofilaceae archaeon]
MFVDPHAPFNSSGTEIVVGDVTDLLTLTTTMGEGLRSEFGGLLHPLSGGRSSTSSSALREPSGQPAQRSE